MAEEKLITLRTYSFHNESLIDKAKLESAGITCMLVDENTILVQPFYSNAIGGIKLQVNQSDVEQAMQILADSPEPMVNEVDDIEELEYQEEFKETEQANKSNYKWGCISMIIIAVAALAFLIARDFIFD